mmetsp:Transcript_53387/g.114777  ORF Transcript_53387/g.114777 Transcript_53387/m.114777 type:complete len:199 (+) Transcript_53387:112-708(+)
MMRSQEDFEMYSGPDIIEAPEFCPLEEPVVKTFTPAIIRNLPSCRRLMATLKIKVSQQHQEYLDTMARAKRMPRDDGACEGIFAMMDMMARAKKMKTAVKFGNWPSLKQKTLTEKLFGEKALQTPCMPTPAKDCILLAEQYMAGPASLSLRSLRDCGCADVEGMKPFAPKMPKPESSSRARPRRHILACARAIGAHGA